MKQKDFGEYVKKIRKAKGLTTTELAKRTGISQSYISQIENGKRGIPTDEMLLSLARGLGEDYAEFLKTAGRNSSPIDNQIRHFVHLLLSDHPFGGTIESEFNKGLSELFDKHGIQSVATIDSRLGVNEKNERISDFLCGVNNIQFKYDVLKELQRIAHEYHLWFDEFFHFTSEPPEATRIETILESQTPLAFKSHLLSREDRQRILDMLSVLFPENKEE